MLFKNYYSILILFVIKSPERTKEMEPILRAKVNDFFKSENLKKISY